MSKGLVKKLIIGVVIMVVVYFGARFIMNIYFQSRFLQSSFSTQNSAMANKGTAKIERWWEEGSGNNAWVYILVSYENTTGKTLVNQVEVIGTIYDSAGTMIDQDDGYFFAHEIGSMPPGFKGTVKLMIKSVEGRAQKADVKVTKAF